MQKLNGMAGMMGLPQDTVIAASGMLGAKDTTSNAWPYWWLFPRAETQFVHRVASIATPASATLTQVVSYEVPEGFCFVLRGYRHTAQISGGAFIDGSGDILWSITVDQPIGSVALSGYGLPDLSNMADQRGSQLGPWPVEGHTVFDQFQILRYTVLTTAAIPVGGGTNFITCGLFGWLAKALP